MILCFEGLSSWNNGMVSLESALQGAAAEIAQHENMTATAESTSSELDRQAQAILAYVISQFITPMTLRRQCYIFCINNFPLIAVNMIAFQAWDNQLLMQ